MAGKNRSGAGDTTARMPGARTAGQSREARIKAALKANLARRKAQARARSAVHEVEPAADTFGPDRQG